MPPAALSEIDLQDPVAARIRGRLSYAIPIVLAFAVVYAQSHSFGYVEGDDASSVAFHALGRDRALQPPYSAYQGMMDVALGVLPPSESVVRVAALILTSVAAVGVVTLSVALVFEWLGLTLVKRRVATALVLMAACPELFFLGLVYTPMLVAMSLALAAHLLIRRAVRPSAPAQGRNREWLVPASVVLFGMGVACRWDSVFYGFVISSDLLFGVGARRLAVPSRNQIVTATCWAAAAVLASWVFVSLSGADASAIGYWLRFFRAMSSGYFRAAFGFMAFVAQYQSFLSPAFVVLAAVGWWHLIRAAPALAVKAVVGLVPLLPLIYDGVPKLLLPAFPGLVLCFTQGVELLWFSENRAGSRRWARTTMVVVLLAPWLIGLKVYSPDTQWGPGFEIRTPDPRIASASYREHSVRNIAIRKLALTSGGGCALPTGEGPRPLGGYGAVLIGGQWRGFVTRLEEERREAIRQAGILRRPILQDDLSALILIHLLEMGLATGDPRATGWHGFVERRFVNRSGTRLTLLQTDNRALYDLSRIDALLHDRPAGQIVFYTGYTSSLSRLVSLAPGSVRPLGPFSGLVDLHRVRQALAGGTRMRVPTSSSDQRLRKTTARMTVRNSLPTLQ